jgi:hypothetical protein
VALIGGASVEDRSFNELGRQAVQVFGDRLRLIDLTGLPIDEMLARLSVLPQQTIVLTSSIRVDGAGRRFYGVDLIGPLSTTANRPLFALFGTVMGLGTVGGSMIDFEAVGREAARSRCACSEASRCRRVLRSAASNVPLFDWRQLRRWNLDERRLPPGSQVLYRHPSLWEQYRWHIAVTLIVVAAQASLIVGLLIERQRRRRAQAGLAERLDFETLVASISATFAGLPTDRVDEHIRDCLRRIVLFIGADRVPCGNLRPTGKLYPPPIPGPRRARIRSRDHPHERVPDPPAARPANSPASFASLDELPPEARAERHVFEKLGVNPSCIAAADRRPHARYLGVLRASARSGHRPAELVAAAPDAGGAVLPMP